MPQHGDIISDKYKISSALGAGGMGVVYAAHNLRTGRAVALKFLNAELVGNAEATRRFEREILATGQIDHPNVVSVLDCGEHLGSLYLVMELLHGETLAKRLRAGFLKPEPALQLFFPVCRGVAAAHAHGILHRDLKPENIFLTASPDGLEPVPKVLDFGVAKVIQDAEGSHLLSAQSGLLGTFQYMAPEQLQLAPDLDASVDVYALGVVLYRMLTGKLPYAANNPIDLAMQILAGEAPLANHHVPSLAQGLAEVIAKALAHDRRARFRDVDQLCAALQPFSESARYRGHSGPNVSESALPQCPPSTPLVESKDSPSAAFALPSSVRSQSSPKGVPLRGRGRPLAVVALAAGAALLGLLSVHLRTPSEHDHAPSHTAGAASPIVKSAPALTVESDWAADDSAALEKAADPNAPQSLLPNATAPAVALPPIAAEAGVPQGQPDGRERLRKTTVLHRERLPLESDRAPEHRAGQPRLEEFLPE